MIPISSYTEVIRKERPLLAKIVDEYGELRVLDFSTHLFQKGALQSYLYRPEFIDLVSLAFPKIPTNVIQQFDASLRKNPIVSTADHHCIINHPVYLNSNILLSLFAKNFSQNKTPIVSPPILSFSAIPLNNAAYPRGILLANPEGERRFSFFGTEQRHQSVSLVDPLPFSNPQIENWSRQNKARFREDELEFIIKMLLDLVSNSNIANSENFLEQTQIFNSWLWSKVFPGVELFFLPVEKLAETFFCRILIKNKSLPLFNFLFNFPLEKQDQLFDGIYGAWSLARLNQWLPGGGTSFFWGITKEKRTIPLKRVEGFLTSKEENFKPIKWEAESLAQALQEKRIIPSILLIYLVLVHYGLYCSGAFNQIGYLSPILEQYKKGLREISEEKETQRVERLLADGIHAFLYFLFGESKDKIIPLCSFNILQSNEKFPVEKMLKNITLKEVFEITAPLIFPFVTDPKTRDQMKFSFEEVYHQLKDRVPQELIWQRW